MRSRWRAARSIRSRASHTAGSGRARRASVTVSHRDAHAHKGRRQHDGPCTAAGGPPPAPRVSPCGAVPAGSRCRAGLHLSDDRSCRGLATDSAVRTGGPGRRGGWRRTPLGVMVNAIAVLAFAAASPDAAVGERAAGWFTASVVIASWDHSFGFLTGALCGVRGLEFGGVPANTLTCRLFLATGAARARRGQSSASLVIGFRASASAAPDREAAPRIHRSCSPAVRCRRVRCAMSTTGSIWTVSAPMAPAMCGRRSRRKCSTGRRSRRCGRSG